MPDTIDSLQIELSANATSAERSLGKLADTLIRLQSSLKGLSGGQFQNLSSGIQQLSASMQQFSGTVKTADFTRIATGLNKLSAVNVQGVSAASKAINNLTTNLSKIGTIAFDSQGIVNVANAIAQLGRKTVTQASSNIPLLAQSLQSLVTGLNQIGAVKFDVSSLAELTSSITKLGGKSATNAASGNITKLAIALKEMMKILSSSPKVSQNLIQMTQALAQLATTGSRAGTATNTLVKSFNLLPSSTAKAKSGFNGLAGAIGKFYATYWLLIRGIGQFKKAIDISSALTEVQNVVDVSFGDMSNKMDEFARSALNLYGMSELTAKQIGSRFQAMGVSMGFAQEDMTEMSIRLTQLAGDLASFYNLAQEDVAKKLQSIFTGETEPLRSLGLDLSFATVEAWALSQGIDADMRSMTQAEKTMLRYQYVLANTGAATNDFVRTQNSWANQLRLLTGAFEQLGSIVGGVLVNAFKPFIQALNNVMGAVINFAQVVSDALGAIFGWEYQTGGGVANDMESAAGAAGDLEDATGGAAKNAKELNRYIAAWHEVNNMTSDEGSKGSGGGGAGGGGLAGAADGGQWVQTESLWEKYTSSIDSLYKLGDYIGKTLTDAMNSIDWDSVYESARNFGTGLASFLNGLISPELFGTLGTTIAGALNTALYALNSFGTTFDWTEFGISIATGINNFFSTYDFGTLGETINVWANGVLDALLAGIDRVDWKKIGVQIGTFLEKIDFMEIGGKVAQAIWKAINAGLEVWKGMFNAAPIETALLSILTIVTKLDKIKTLATLFTSLGSKAKASAKKVTTLVTALQGNQSSVLILSQYYPKLFSTLQDVTKGFEALKASIKNGDVFGGLNTAISGIRNNLTGIQKAAITAGSGFAEFSLIKDSMTELASGTEDVVTNLIKLGAGAATGAAGMYVALGPAGLAIAAITGVIAAIEGINEAFKETTGYNQLQEELGRLSDSADEVNRKSQEIKDTLSGLQTDFEETGLAQAGVAENLADKYEMLHSKANPTAADIALMREYSKQLVQMYPELEEFFNNETGLLETTRDTIQQVIDKNIQLAKSNAALEGMEEAYRQQIEASRNLKEAKENEAEAQRKVNEIYEKNREYLEEHPTYATTGVQSFSEGDPFGLERNAILDAGIDAGNTLKEAQKAVQNAQEAFDNATESVKLFGDEYDKAIKETVEPSNELKKNFEEIGTAFDDKVLRKIEGAGTGATDAITGLFAHMNNGIVAGRDELENSFESLGISLPTAFIDALSSQTDSTVQSQMTQILLNLASGVPQSAEELNLAFEAIGFNLPQNIVDGLSQNESIVQNGVVTLLGKIESGVSLKDQELEELFTGLGVELPVGLAESMAKNNSVVQQNTINLLSQIESGEAVKDETLKDLFSSLGVSLTDNMINAFKEKTKPTQEQVIEYLNQIESGEKLKDYELKTLFSSLGINLSDELIGALQGKEAETYNQAISLLMQLPNATDEKREEILRDLNDLGISEGEALIEGLDSKSSDYQDAGEQAQKDIASGASQEAEKTGAGSIYEAGQKAGNSLLEGLKSIGSKIANWWNGLFNTPEVTSVSTNGVRTSRMVETQSVNSESMAMPMSDGVNNLVGSVNSFVAASRNGINIPVPQIDVGFSSSSITSPQLSSVNAMQSESLRGSIDYGFKGLIDYDRLGQAVYQAQSQAMKENPLQIGDKDVFDANVRETKRFGQRTHKNPYPIY